MASRVRWGQCFLVDQDAALRIVDWADVADCDVVEIGPGRGALTLLLRERARSLTLVEIDPHLAAQWKDRYADDAAVSMVEGDALRVDWISRAPVGFTLVANLPYESGTAIVASVLAQRTRVRRMVVMLQKEVVSRLTASPGSKVYGALSVLVQMVADVEPGMVVAPRSFRPRPRVESQLVRLTPLAQDRFDPGDHDEFRGVVQAAFSQRRKMLRNNLGRQLDVRFGEGSCARVLEEAAIPGDIRPEQLDVEQFAALSRAVVALREAKTRADTAPGRVGPVDEGDEGNGGAGTS